MSTVELLDKGFAVFLVAMTACLSAFHAIDTLGRNPNWFGAFCAIGWASFACFVSASLIRDRLSA